jgi:ATP-binding cassette subfamily C (CFTR/MRP) protein 1
VTIIYRKTTEISLTALDNSAAVTLMNTDVERIIQGLRMMHEDCANIIQVGIATWLLQRELGVACVAPIAVSIGKCLIPPSVFKIISTDPQLASVSGAFGMSSTAGQKQAEWMKHIQKRVGRLHIYVSQCTAS